MHQGGVGVSNWAAIYMTCCISTSMDYGVCAYLLAHEHERWALALLILTMIGGQVAFDRMKTASK